MIGCGVYIGRDVEWVLTDRYAIAYRRNAEQNYLESRLYRAGGDGWTCIGACRTSPTETEQYRPPARWQRVFLYHGKVETEDPEMERLIGSTLTLTEHSAEFEVDFGDGAVYRAALCEPFEMADLCPAVPDAREDNVGECLRLWGLGVTEEFADVDGAQAFVGVTIDTPKHMYIFEMGREWVYCRAARYATTDRGVVFNQNFRQGFEAYMIADNARATLPIEYDEAHFASDTCAWNDRSVYWSVASVSLGEIELHGCQGDIYHRRKPTR